MRSAGCVYNDIVDKKIDFRVQRTKKRLIARADVLQLQNNGEQKYLQG